MKIVLNNQTAIPPLNMKSRIPNIMKEHFTGSGPTLANNLPTLKELFTECLTINHMDFTLALSAYLKDASDIISNVLTKILVRFLLS